MDYFADHEQFKVIEARVLQAQGSVPLAHLTELAWQLRQRDNPRAMALVEDIEHCLPTSDLDSTTQKHMALRLALIRAETIWLQAKLRRAISLVNTIIADAQALGDRIIVFDAYTLKGLIGFDQGDFKQVASTIEATRAILASIDRERHQLALISISMLTTFTNSGTTLDDSWREALGPVAALHPAIRAVLADLQGKEATRQSDFAKAAQHYTEGFGFSINSGQQARAICGAAAIARMLTRLNAPQPALEWAERALTLARKCNWPATTGLALLQTAKTMRRLEHHAQAYDLLQEALSSLMPIAGSPHYAKAMCLLGEMELDRKEYGSAVNTFHLVLERADAMASPALQSIALRGKAHALCHLNQPELALYSAHAALICSNKPAHKIAAFQVMAIIHAKHTLPAPKGMQAASIPLHYLQQALDLANNTPGFIISVSLLDAMAHEYANLGLYQQAWETGLQANETRQISQSREAQLRASAMQLNRASELARFEAEHLRQLAESESQRAEALQKNSDTLARLGVIGREITACLETELIFQVMDRHLQHLLDVTTFAIYLLEPGSLSLNLAFGVGRGQFQPDSRILLSDHQHEIVRCIRERHELLCGSDASDNPDESRPAERNPNRSRMFSPMYEADQVMGAITIQSQYPHAYGEREQLIFRTLCAYAAIALANADAHNELACAHRQLQETQHQMLLQEKMAGLGTLTAGVAHEINNPTNFVHVAAQNQRVHIEEFRQYVDSMIEVDDAPDIVAGFARRFAKLDRGVSTMLNGTERIKGIVRDLRAFTRLDEAEKKAVHLSECLISTLNLVRTNWLEKVEFITDFRNDPEIECWPALLNQVFMNLLVNGCQAIEERLRQQASSASHTAANDGDSDSAALHAPPQPGRLWLRLYQSDDTLFVAFEDNGSGISAEDQTRIMEPFYTTKAVGVGTGLGLSIAFGIVQKHGGQLHFSSTPGEGSCFTIQLPLAGRHAPSEP